MPAEDQQADAQERPLPSHQAASFRAVRAGRTHAPLDACWSSRSLRGSPSAISPAGIAVRGAIEHDAAIGDRQDRRQVRASPPRTSRRDRWRRSRISRSSPADVIGSSPAEGSSRNSSGGSSAIARAMAARLRHAAGDLGRHQRSGIGQTDRPSFTRATASRSVRRQIGEHLERQHDVLEQAHRAEQGARTGTSRRSRACLIPLRRSPIRPGDEMARDLDRAGCRRSAVRSTASSTSICRNPNRRG